LVAGLVKFRTGTCRVTILDLPALARRLATRSPQAEANKQADIQTLLLYGGLNLGEGDLDIVELEAQVGGGRRIDIEVGLTAIEVKRDLRQHGVRDEAERQLAGYVRDRTTALAQRYAGILTDGSEWRLYHLTDDALEEVAAFALSSATADAEGLIVWLEGALATVEAIAPTPREIERRLGAGSSGHALAFAELERLYAKNRDNPTVRLKRELWARLLRTAFGTSFEDDDQLFIDHTLLVVSAEIIAHAVVSIDPTMLAPASVVNGQQFAQAGISGVIEEDFFDWVVEIPEGDELVRSLARRLTRFAWEDVEHDVMKVLYESIITTDWRHRLGEYYTPDWLAACMVAETIDDPLNQRVLDPACGSGTFLFQAVRRYLAAAAEDGMSDAEAIVGATGHVFGIDVHPVAITLARLTYLLAIGRDRLRAPGRPNIHVPVYLGDSVQWRSPEENLWTREGLTIAVDDDIRLWASSLHFPSRLLDDAGKFDRLVEDLADRAARHEPGAPVPSLATTFTRLAVHPEDQPIVETTFATMCRLNDEGRNHVWSFFVRNLARPLWLSRVENRVDRIVGNPPWLAYRFMTIEMQVSFRQMSEERGLWAGASVATHQDLSGLFLVRSVELYLKQDGRFALVMPLAALSRRQFAGLRTGKYGTHADEVDIAFDTPWDLHQIKPNLFRVPPSVVIGRRAPVPSASPMPGRVERWSGRLPGRNISWELAEPHVTREGAAVAVAAGSSKSPYHTRFAAGATLFPRLLVMVEDAPASPIGVAEGRRAVRSMRSANEKPPWKRLASLQGSIEEEFVRTVHLGSTLLPFRLLKPWLGVIPWDGRVLLNGANPALEEHPGLADWWIRAESLWDGHKGESHMTFMERLDYRRDLSRQLPTTPHRVFYSASGQYLTAARNDDECAVAEHKLYWAVADSVEEARYLTAMLNSPALTRLLAPMQSRGEHNPRDFDKLVWRLPIPVFDPGDGNHQRLAELAAAAEALAAETDVSGKRTFQAQRRLIREALERDGIAQAIDEKVLRLLSAE
jgi:SAM-dependent methyltransferase